jgi:signal transduction histidine kinase
MVAPETTSGIGSKAWPVLAALGLVVLLLIGMIGVDVLESASVTQRTGEIVENSQRSIELVDDLRAQAHRMADFAGDADRIRGITERIAADAKAYDPLANFPGEREEWTQLQGALAELQRRVQSRSPDLIQQVLVIGQSIDRLVLINRTSAHEQAAAIRALHRQALAADAAAGGITLVLVSGVALVLVRVLRRQRRLTEQHIALLSDRNRELDAFAGRAAHDLRGPLNPMRGYADLLLTGRESPAEVQGMARKIRIAVDRMSRTIDDMLELSRAGRPQAGKASPSEVATEVLSDLSGELAGAKVVTSLTDEKVACAPGVLYQILRNLVSNAIKFRARQRPLELQLSAALDGDQIELSIDDNGVGMDAESATHAFEPLFRASRTDREVPGHGLGLAIVERATRALGGSCALTSVPDAGTRIRVRLPRAA